jgi:tRNA(fMet)-specific endonuclease VapC
MAALIDSSVLIAAERGDLAIDEMTRYLAEEDVAISAVTASELLHGLYRARTALQRSRRQVFVEGLLAEIPVIPFDLGIARVHASIWAELAKRGVAVGERDLMIGATALGHNFSIVTRDQRSFPRIPGLKLRQL